MDLPDFLCIGAQKAGTSWLNNVLLEHPQVFMPPVNELHFFDRVGDAEAPLRKRQINLAHKAIRREEAKGDAANPDTFQKFWADMQMYSTTGGVDPQRHMERFCSWDFAQKANKWAGRNVSRW